MNLSRRDFVSSAVGASAALASGGLGLVSRVGAAAPADANSPLEVCLLSGCPTYNSEKSVTEFQPFLEKEYGCKCTRAFRREANDLPGLENLETCDVALVFIKRMQLAGEQLKRFQDYCLSGRPIVAVRTASHAVQTWLEFDRQVLGGNYSGHYDKIETQIHIREQARQSPLVAGFDLQTDPGPLYKNAGHAADIDILMTGSIPGHEEPLTWTREYKGGRIFYTSLGCVETFAVESFRRMLANALFWAARREVAAGR